MRGKWMIGAVLLSLALGAAAVSAQVDEEEPSRQALEQELRALEEARAEAQEQQRRAEEEARSAEIRRERLAQELARQEARERERQVEGRLRMQEAELREQGIARERAVELEQELYGLRQELDRARRELEEAARGIATVSAAPLRSLTFADGYRLLTSRAELGLVTVDADDGVRVVQLTPGGPAEQAGLRVGDVIRSIDGESLAPNEQTPYVRLLGNLRDITPGDTVTLAVVRGDEERTVDVTTGEGGSSASAFMLPVVGDHDVIVAPNRSVGAAAQAPLRGLNVLRTLSMAAQPWGDMELVAVTEGLGRYFNTTEGLLVVRGPGSDAIGIGEGDVILSINGREPNSPEHALRILGSYEPGETIEFSIMRDRQTTAVEYLVPEASRQGPSEFGAATIVPAPPSAPAAAEPAPFTSE